MNTQDILNRARTAGVSPIGELRLVPDAATFTILPWRPELMWRAYQEVKLAECNAFEANDEEFEFKAHFDVF